VKATFSSCFGCSNVYALHMRGLAPKNGCFPQ
jgi:hypothetical protein